MALKHENGAEVTADELEHHKDLYALVWLKEMLRHEFDHSAFARDAIGIAEEAMDYKSEQGLQPWQRVAKYEKAHRRDMEHLQEQYLGAAAIGDFRIRFGDLLTILETINTDDPAELVDAKFVTHLRHAGFDFSQFWRFLDAWRRHPCDIDYARSMIMSGIATKLHNDDGSVSAVRFKTTVPYVETTGAINREPSKMTVHEMPLGRITHEGGKAA